VAGDVGLAAERGAVPGQQDRRPGADLRGDDPGVQAAFGQVQAVELDIGAGLADAVQGGHQGVQVVNHLVTVRQHRAGYAEAVTVGLEQADQELPGVGRVAGQVVAVQPAVHVRVPQVRSLVVRGDQQWDPHARLRDGRQELRRQVQILPDIPRMGGGLISADHVRRLGTPRRQSVRLSDPGGGFAAGRHLGHGKSPSS
jgi:hypothetical protein